MAEFEFLKSLIIILGVSAVALFILNKFRIPSVAGFLIAGVLIGPHGLELIKDIRLVEIFAEIGVVLLLFTIGLEFSLKKLLALRKTIFVGGLLQVLITFLIVFALSNAGGKDVNTSLILAFLIPLSSTAIVMKLLFERAEIDSPHGRISLGLLIFQDFCVVIFMLMIPLLAGGDKGIKEIMLVLIKSAAIIAAVIISARWLVPRALHQIVHTKMRELFIISIIFICLGAAYLTFKLGLSLALGAFIAGIIISESEYSYQAVSDILPFKESFNGLFFISVGMLMNISFFASNLSAVLLAVLVIILLKTLTSTIAVLIMGSNLRVSLHTGLILSQIGEFSFVLAVAALKAGLITEGTYQYFLSTAIITMLLTPIFLYISPQVSIWVTSRKLLARLQETKASAEMSKAGDRKNDHVIIIGFGINGRNLAMVLKDLEVPYVVLEMNSRTVSKWRGEGEPIFYGDGTSQEILQKLGIKRAKAVVVSISDPSAARKIVMTARKANPGIYLAVKTGYLAEVQDLLSIGADEVIPAEFETSIQLFSRVLQFYHMPGALIEKYARKFRKDHYRLFVKGETPKRLFHDTIAVMPDVDYESHVVEKDSPSVGSSVRELDIQQKTGAHVIAVKRGGETIKGLLADLIFQEGDIVFLIGDKSSLENACRLFFKGKM
jgi:CPA2 family monovalent cation:H+ antiporter-2